MASSSQNNMLSNDWICTQTRGDNIEFEWTIKKFHLLPQLNGVCIHSPVFPNNSVERWQIAVYPHGQQVEDVGWISVSFWPASEKMRGIEVKYEITIFQLNKVLGTTQSTYKFGKIKSHGEPKLAERSKLSVGDDPTDTITIRCNIGILGTRTSSSSLSVQKILNRAVTFGVRKNGLSRDFKSLYKNPTLTNFTVISGNKVFLTHKAILASRSPVFAAMFQHNEADGNVENQLRIEEIEPAVVAGLLEFIYTDDVSEIEDLAHGLLVAAEQYGLQDLKELCERSLCKSLNENNAVELLALANRHNANYLKECVIQYIADHPKIAKSESFKSLQLTLELSREIINALAFKACENRAH